MIFNGSMKVRDLVLEKLADTSKHIKLLINL